jgi:hypothetical protein
MSGPLLHTEWRNNNERINYPFADHATLTNSSGDAVDRDLFDDARLYPIGGTAGLYLGKISVDGSELTFHIYDLAGELATGVFDLGSPPAEVALYDAYGRPAGILVSDTERLGALAGIYGEGEIEFEQDQTEFAASVAVPLPDPGVRGVLLDDGNVLSGDIWLVGEDGVVLRMDGTQIRMDVIGDPYVQDKDCENEGSPLPQFCGLKSINQITPNDAGDFKLRVGGNLVEDPVVRIVPITNGVRVEMIGMKGEIDQNA